MKLTTNVKENLEIVKKAAKECFKNYPILQELTLVQAILEGGLLRSPPSQLALLYCNLFGMKPGSIIKAGTSEDPLYARHGIIMLPTKECDKYHCWKESQPFLWNSNIEDSFAQHELLFTKLSRYKNLFTAKSFEEAARMVQADGYATSPTYTDDLIRVYKTYVRGK